MIYLSRFHRPHCFFSCRAQWIDTDVKSNLWQSIAHGNVDKILSDIETDGCVALARAGDGRGPLFWAHEFYNEQIIKALVAAGADPNARDLGGMTPAQMPRVEPMPAAYEAPPSLDDDETEYDDDDDPNADLAREEL